MRYFIEIILLLFRNYLQTLIIIGCNGRSTGAATPRLKCTIKYQRCAYLICSNCNWWMNEILCNKNKQITIKQQTNSCFFCVDMFWHLVWNQLTNPQTVNIYAQSEECSWWELRSQLSVWICICEIFWKIKNKTI